MEFKFKEPGTINAFGYEFSSDKWTKVDDKAIAEKLEGNSHFECKTPRAKTPKGEKAEITPS